MADSLIDSSFWRDKRVFVTGNTGFKGSWMTAWLYDMGAKVAGYALKPPTDPSMYDALQLEELCEQTYADICEANKLKSAIEKFQPEIVFHMAAQPIVLQSYKDPIETYQTNVMGTAHLLNSCRDVESVRLILNVTSDKVYENLELDRGYAENDQLGGFDPYSNSKGCSELVTKSFRRSFFQDKGVLVASGRAGNVIGGGDWGEYRLLPDAAKAFSTSEPVLVRNPASIRPWQHVLEPLSGYLLVAQAGVQNNSLPHYEWNVGPREEDMVTVGEVLDIFKNEWQEGASWITEGKIQRPKETKFLRLDCSRIHEELKWSPQIPLPQALKMSADWYKSFYQQSSITELREITFEQIRKWGAR